MSGRTDGVQSVTCTVKPAVYLHIGDSKTDPSHSGVCVVDVSLPFGKPVNVCFLSITCGIHDTQHTSVSHMTIANSCEGQLVGTADSLTFLWSPPGWTT